MIFGFDLIYGLPGDNLSGFCNSIDFALNLMPNNLELFCLSVLPGTDLFDAAKGYGLVFQEEVCQSEVIFVIQHIQILDDTLVSDVSATLVLRITRRKRLRRNIFP